MRLALFLGTLPALLLTACRVPQASSSAQAAQTFTYDRGALSGATPWTSKEFEDDPVNFQFVIIGDRIGGANVQGPSTSPWIRSTCCNRSS